MHCNLLWIKASAKCINVNINLFYKLTVTHLSNRNIVLYIFSFGNTPNTERWFLWASIWFNWGFLLFFLSQVSDKGSLTAEEFAKLLGLSVLLAKERYRRHPFPYFINNSSLKCLLTISMYCSSIQVVTNWKNGSLVPRRFGRRSAFLSQPVLTHEADMLSNPVGS